ncbi:MAG: hypothetical protein K5891_08850 [Lachnospiraceae bacterium]|nr:hypothetical protein [Lachnospiraceae bacterium]
MAEPAIYGILYDTVAANMEAAGAPFGYRRPSMTCNAGMHPRIVDVSRYEELDNADYFQAAFVGVFKRLPEVAEEAPWQQHYGEDRTAFRTRVWKVLTGSTVFAIRHMELTENPYCTPRMGLRYHLLGRVHGLTARADFRTFGKKLPAPIQKLIRKVFL